MKGTSTGEHGIGIGKKNFLKTEKGNSVKIMSQIKRSIDPNNIMNLGKKKNHRTLGGEYGGKLVMFTRGR